MKAVLRRLWREESGQDLIEYALLASFLAMVSFAALNTMGGAVVAFYRSLGQKVSSF